MLNIVIASLYAAGEAKYFAEYSADIQAVVGQNVTLNCTLKNIGCSAGYTLHWKRGSGMTAQANAAISHGTSMYIDTERYTVYHSPLRSCKWTLHIQNVQPNDEGYYNCYIYKTSPEIDTENSNVMKLTTVQPIDTTVNPSDLNRKVGESAMFRCETSQTTEYNLKYVWFLKTDGRSWQQVSRKIKTIDFNDKKKP